VRALVHGDALTVEGDCPSRRGIRHLCGEEQQYSRRGVCDEDRGQDLWMALQTGHCSGAGVSGASDPWFLLECVCDRGRTGSTGHSLLTGRGYHQLDHHLCPGCIDRPADSPSRSPRWATLAGSGQKVAGARSGRWRVLPARGPVYAVRRRQLQPLLTVRSTPSEAGIYSPVTSVNPNDEPTGFAGGGAAAG